MTDEELWRALDGLYAYGMGSRDSGIHDQDLKERVKAELISRTGEYETGPRIFLSRVIRDMWLSEEALAQGYGIEDALSFVQWLEDEMEMAIK